MIWIDYHVHSNNSADCKVSMAKMCEGALEHGVAEIAFTEHLNSHPKDTDGGYYNPDRYFADLEACRKQFPTLTIRAGVEVGEPHRWSQKVQPILDRYPYDVVLGSLHWVGDDNMFDPAYFRSRSAEKAFNDYFVELAAMIRYGGFDILSHVDVPKRVGASVYGGFNDQLHEQAIRGVWQACIESGITPEINTKGIRSAAAQLHPSANALRWYVDMGGERLTLGSDAHRPEQIANYFDEARQVALSVGLNRICRFERRQIVAWEPL